MPNSTQWNFPLNNNLSAPCTNLWQGLWCSYLPVSTPVALCTIQNITLNNMNLFGSLPTSIGALSNVEVSVPISLICVKIIACNQIDNICACESMYFSFLFEQELWLFSNRLTGTLPWQCGFMIHIKVSICGSLRQFLLIQLIQFNSFFIKSQYCFVCHLLQSDIQCFRQPLVRNTSIAIDSLEEHAGFALSLSLSFSLSISLSLSSLLLCSFCN